VPAKSNKPRALILCGGRGTRAYPHTLELPKALLEVAERPVLRHVMDLYAAQGFTDFVLAAGFKHELIAEFAATLPREWTVSVRDTGLDTATGARVAACRDELGERFFATYADGLADVDLGAVLAFHAAHGAPATVTSVPLPSQYGTLDVDDDGRVRRFVEKPVLPDHWINGGFFAFDERVFARWTGDDLEGEVLPALAAAGELRAYRHHGFWKSMDTYKDALELTRLASGGRPPWTRLPARASS
jgi:glucose-1-phosphate cytidylyltransferase